MIAAWTLCPTTGFAQSAEAYAQLKSLAGEWEADLPGFGKMTSSVRLVSNGRAIQEIIGTPADNEVSIYTLNADKILLTHYCAMTPDGHQVRLQTPKLSSTLNRLEFSFVSATNLHNKAAPHMRRVVMLIADRDHYSEKWTKTENGKDTEFDLDFVRR
jgi:hypothetical protein